MQICTHGHTLHLCPCLLSAALPPVVLCLSCHTHTHTCAHTHWPLATVRRCTPLWTLCSTLSVSRDAFRHLSVRVWQVILRFPLLRQENEVVPAHAHTAKSGSGRKHGGKYVKLAAHIHGASCISKCYRGSWEIIGYNWDPFRCFLSVCRFVLPSTTKAVASALHHGRVNTYLSFKLSQGGWRAKTDTWASHWFGKCWKRCWEEIVELLTFVGTIFICFVVRVWCCLCVKQRAEARRQFADLQRVHEWTLRLIYASFMHENRQVSNDVAHILPCILRFGMDVNHQIGL